MTQSTVEAIEGMVSRDCSGMHPQDVANVVVVDAIDSPERKLRYIVGRDP
jgi:hypothetical protein